MRHAWDVALFSAPASFRLCVPYIATCYDEHVSVRVSKSFTATLSSVIYFAINVRRVNNWATIALSRNLVNYGETHRAERRIRTRIPPNLLVAAF